jgi:transcriptional regulator with XRE-family HTH domain
MAINPILKIIRAKKIGVLVRDARLKSGKSLEECAQAIGVSTDELTAMEYGDRPPTMPELEMFAYLMELPLDHFWGNEVLQADGKEGSIDPAEIKQIRQNMIGALLRKARIEAELSIDDLADRAGLEGDVLESYEKGEQAIPITELEVLANAMSQSMDRFEAHEGKVGDWFSEQKNMREYLALPRELQEFIGKPVNRPYLELAIKISEIKAEKLRALAEGLLDITL